MFSIEYEYDFGRSAARSPRYGAGWSSPENGFTWTTSAKASLRMPRPRPSAQYVLEFLCHPCVQPEIHPMQRLVVSVSGTVIGSARLTEHNVIAFLVPAYLARTDLTITLHAPDIVNVADKFGSNDNRELGIGFMRARLFAQSSVSPRQTKVDIPDGHPMAAFESLGDNCEFGLAQRKAGIEPLSLLRFSGQPIRYLVNALDEKFRAFDDDDALRIVLSENSSEMALYVQPYHMHYHTHVNQGEMEPGTLIGKQRLRLKFLARKFLEDAETGRKVFVLKRNQWLTWPEILPVFVALQRIGPAPMLVLRPADPSHLAGSVEALGSGIFAGYISQFGEYGRPEVKSLDEWTTVCTTVLDMLS